MAAGLADFQVRLGERSFALRFDFALEPGAVTVLFGPSGAGKTTALRCLAGLSRPLSGRIEAFGEVWSDATTGAFLPARQRRIGMVFQEGALFPHLTAAENAGYGLRGVTAAERNRRVAAMLDRLGVGGLARQSAAKLSGGERQRVALARALVPAPRLLLLDEPFSSLDDPTRERLRAELRAHLAELAVPAVLVTHDRADVMALGGRLAVLDGGRVRQEGAVDEVLAHPADADVARILGRPFPP